MIFYIAFIKLLLNRSSDMQNESIIKTKCLIQCLTNSWRFSKVLSQSFQNWNMILPFTVIFGGIACWQILPLWSKKIILTTLSAVLICPYFFRRTEWICYHTLVPDLRQGFIQEKIGSENDPSQKSEILKRILLKNTRS